MDDDAKVREGGVLCQGGEEEIPLKGEGVGPFAKVGGRGTFKMEGERVPSQRWGKGGSFESATGGGLWQSRSSHARVATRCITAMIFACTKLCSCMVFCASLQAPLILYP